MRHLSAEHRQAISRSLKGRKAAPGTVASFRERLIEPKQRLARDPVAIEERFWRQISTGLPDECWPWHGDLEKYGRFYVHGMSPVPAHRFAWALYHGKKLPPSEVVIRHVCDNGGCCNPAHLLAGTQADNIADKMSRHREARGARHGRAKLNPVQADEIRKRYRRRDPVNGSAPLAREYGVHRMTISAIVNGHHWSVN